MDPTSPIDRGGFDRAKARLSADAEQVVETHAALIFLKEDRALKLKKPVDLGYLDYATPQRRREAVERELRLNAATAPQIYRRVVEIEGEAVLEMVRFPQDRVLSESPERLDGDLAEALGREVARVHARAAPMIEGGGRPYMDFVADSNLRHIRALGLGVTETEALGRETQAAIERLTPLLEARRAAGLARLCHGDLHLANIVVLDDRPVLFDCIEFSERLATIDVLYDLAFLLMDLGFRARDEAASRVLNAWLDEAARSFGESVFTGLRALPLYMSVRAAVRCHVAGQTGDPALARRYLDYARDLLRPEPVRLAAVGGRSGSGKTTRARTLAAATGRAPGAVVLRSDELRKRLAGAGPLERLPPEAYTAPASERVYARLLDEARLCLDAGRSVVLDAAFLKPEERRAAGALARAHGVPFEGLWLEPPVEVLRARVAARTGDASDADLAVLESQLARDPGPIEAPWRRDGGA